MDPREFEIDWNRCISIEGEITHGMLYRITPDILRLRSSGTGRITISVNSEGGNVAAMESILRLVNDRHQSSRTGRNLVVVTNRAYSAAAMLLARGDYSVALPHARILFHDVRISEMSDVTPAVAREAAVHLSASNEAAALKMAEKVFERWMWLYICLKPEFAAYNQKEAEMKKAFDVAVKQFNFPSNPQITFDFASFVTSVYGRLSVENRVLLKNAMAAITRLALSTQLVGSVPMYSSPIPGLPGLLDGAKKIYDTVFNKSSPHPFGSTANEADFHQFIVFAVSAMAQKPTDALTDTLDEVLSTFKVYKSLSDKEHEARAQRLVRLYRPAFLDIDLDDPPAGVHDRLVSDAAQVAKLPWLLAVLVSRALLDGDHQLDAMEARCLGIVDEVAGDTSIESRRQFRQKQLAERKALKLTRVRNQGTKRPIWRTLKAEG